MKTLNLTGLTNAERDVVVTLALATAIGWKVESDGFFKFVLSPDGKRGHSFGLHLTDGEVLKGHLEPHPEKPLIIPPYATSADAVIPLLEQWRFGDVIWNRVTEIWSLGLQRGEYIAHENTFPLAACIALLRANGVNVMQ